MNRAGRPERELREIATRMGWSIMKVYRDEGVSGAKSRAERPAFNPLCRDATRRRFDTVMAWSVDRLGRSLQDLVAFLSELYALTRNQRLLATAIGRRASQFARNSLSIGVDK